MAPAVQAVLDAVALRAEAEPDIVVPTLRLLADLDALPDSDDRGTVALAHTLNAQRLTARRDAFRARALGTSDVRALLGGVTRQAVASRVANKSLVSLEIGGRSYFPDWQFGPDGPLPRLPEVLVALDIEHRGVLAADALMRAAITEESSRSAANLIAAGNVETALHYLRAAGG